MDRVFVGLSFVKCYIDDIFVFNNNGKTHQKHLSIILKHMVEHRYNRVKTSVHSSIQK